MGEKASECEVGRSMGRERGAGVSGDDALLMGSEVNIRATTFTDT